MSEPQIAGSGGYRIRSRAEPTPEGHRAVLFSGSEDAESFVRRLMLDSDARDRLRRLIMTTHSGSTFCDMHLPRRVAELLVQGRLVVSRPPERAAFPESDVAPSRRA